MLEVPMEIENLGELDGQQSPGSSCCAGRELWLLAVLPSSAAPARGENPPPLPRRKHTDISLACAYLFTTFQTLLSSEAS